MEQHKVKQLAEKLSKDCDYSLIDLAKVITGSLVDANFHEEAVRLEHYFNARFNDTTNEDEAAEYLSKELYILHVGPSVSPVKYGPYENEAKREKAIEFISGGSDFDLEDDFLLKMDGNASFSEVLQEYL